MKIPSSVAQRHNRKRVGRGSGSGLGKTSGRGHKGQKARAGKKLRPGFEGGQNPLYRRVPKFGFHNPFSQKTSIVNVSVLSTLAKKHSEITPDVLRKEGVVKKQDSVIRILGDGEIKQKIHVKAHHFSKSAKDKIEKAGGTAEIFSNK